jgi:RNA polymerase subunit RPABC4/transcription elongation factor Spt4
MEAIVARGIQILMALSGAYLVALWFVLVVWAYRDIETRSRSVVTQVFSTLLVVLFYVPGLLLYMILRPKQTLDEAFQRSLEEEYLLQDLEELPLCASCQRYVEDDFVICPHCHAQLREPCVACARLVDLRWAVCPYCSAAQGGRKLAEPEKVEQPAARWVAPALRRRKPAVLEPVNEPVRLPAVNEELATAGASVAAPPITVVTADGETTSIRPFDRRRTRAAAWRRSLVADASNEFQSNGADRSDRRPPTPATSNGNGRASNGHTHVFSNSVGEAKPDRDRPSDAPDVNETESVPESTTAGNRKAN